MGNQIIDVANRIRVEAGLAPRVAVFSDRWQAPSPHS